MPSNTLSIKAFDTKAPVICHPPPWPPALPIPPIIEATFFCFATLRYEHPDHPIDFAETAILHYQPAAEQWEGWSSQDANTPRFFVVLTLWQPGPEYTITIDYRWPPDQYRGHSWLDKPFPEDRPYVGQLLERTFAFRNERASCVVHEVPN